MCGTARNFDLMITKICICLDNDLRSQFEFGLYWICKAIQVFIEVLNFI